MTTGDETLSVEFFAAKNTYGLMMCAPPRCGLRQADTLKVDGLTMVAMVNKSILPIDFPEISPAVRVLLVALSKRNKVLPVGEFMARGLVDSYFLKLDVA